MDVVIKDYEFGAEAATAAAAGPLTVVGGGGTGQGKNAKYRNSMVR